MKPSIIHLIFAAAPLVALAACGGDDDVAPTPATTSAESTGASTVDGSDADTAGEVVTFEVTSQSHTEEAVNYPQTPPVGGDHHPAWMNCGVYEDPLIDENAVHSLEHGAVWLTYDPAEAVDAAPLLADLAAGQTHVLVSPYPDQGAAVIATAWGVQQRFDVADLDTLGSFVVAYQQGPQTPAARRALLGGARRTPVIGRGRRGVVAAVLLVAAGAAGLGVGRATAGGDKNRPGEGSVEAGFARDMSTHHAQAVEMAELLRNRTGDDELRLLATDIALTQQTQIGQMRGWLDQWNLPPTSLDPPMAWAGHAVTTMPGMAERDAINNLATDDLTTAEISFLRLMGAHHLGGIDMAQAAFERTSRPEVARLAGSIVTSQTAELGAINDLLTARGEAPAEIPADDGDTLPSDTTGSGEMQHGG